MHSPRPNKADFPCQNRQPLCSQRLHVPAALDALLHPRPSARPRLRLASSDQRDERRTPLERATGHPQTFEIRRYCWCVGIQESEVAELPMGAERSWDMSRRPLIVRPFHSSHNILG